MAQQSDLAGFGVDLHHRDVGTERKRGAVLVEVELAVELFADLRGTGGEVAPADGLGGDAGHADRAGRGVDDDVGDVGFEEPGSELLGLGDHGLGRTANGRSAELQRS